MTEKIEKRTPFTAVANVSFAMNVRNFEAKRKFNEEALAELKALEGDGVRLPAAAYYSEILKGQHIAIGDELLVNEVGNVTQYPYSVFDLYSKCTLEAPCKLKGNTEEVFNRSLIGLDPEEIQVRLAKKDELMKRFHYIPFLSKVK